MKRLMNYLFLAATLALILAALPACAQQNPERLILKDGSYQSVTKWEIQGNRVRYYSAERYTWEELPNDLVDWPATNKYNEERKNDRSTAVGELAKAAEADEIDSPTVAPGLRLPDGGGVFLLDDFHNEPQLIELEQAGGEVNKHMGRNILRAAVNPLALSSKQTVELKGDHAKTQAHLTQPSIYIGVDSEEQKPKQPQDAASALSQASASRGGNSPTPAQNNANADHYGIVRMEKTRDGRVIGNLNIAIYGKVSQKENWIKTTSTPMGPNWVKITPAEPLAPGEYALVELLSKSEINLYVWDFGVDPNAPVNANAWTSRKPEAGQPGQNPELEKRPPN